MWSRYPLTPRSTIRTKHHTVVVDVHAPGRSLRVIVIHTQSPTVHHGDWLADLEKLATVTVDGPTVMTGDFNASWWHPEFRAVLGTTWRDAHVAVGRGLSCSWPTDQWHAIFRWHPPFVRLDHALVSDEVALLDVMDLDVPGSDHLGLVVTVAPARRQQLTLNARPRWDTACLASSSISANVRPSPSSGTNTGSYPKPRPPRSLDAIVPSQTPSASTSRPSGQTTAATVRNLRPSILDTIELGEQPGAVVGVGGVLSRVARREHARATVRGPTTSSPVSSATAGMPGRRGDGGRLQPGVALQRVGVLDHVLDVCRAAAAG